MSFPANYSSSDWAAEQQRWRLRRQEKLPQRIQAMVAFIHTIGPNTQELQFHFNTFLGLLTAARANPVHHIQAVELIRALHPWPLYWGVERDHPEHKRLSNYTQIWERELRFAIEVLTSLEDRPQLAIFSAFLADLLFDQGKNDEASALAQQAAQLGQETGQLAPYTDGSLVLVHWLDKQGQPQKALEKLLAVQKLLESAPSDENERQQLLVKVYELKISILQRAGRLDDALALANTNLAALEDNSKFTSHHQANGHNLRGVIHWARGEYELAIQDLKSASGLYLKANERLPHASALANLGLVYWKKGELDLAEVAMRRSLAIRQHTHAAWGILRVLGDLGMLNFARGELKSAKYYLRKQAKMALQQQDEPQYNLAQGNLAALYLYTQEYARALPSLEQACKNYEKHNRKALLFGSYLDLTLCYAGLGRIQQAWGVFQAAEAIFEAHQQSFGHYKTILLRCKARLLLPETAVPTLQEAATTARMFNLPFDEAGSLLSLAALLVNPEEKMRCWEAGAKILKEIGAAAWLKGHSPDAPPFLLIST